MNQEPEKKTTRNELVGRVSALEYERDILKASVEQTKKELLDERLKNKVIEQKLILITDVLEMIVGKMVNK